MNQDATLKANVEALIPKGLDDIIRKNQEHAQVRQATEADLSPLLSDIPPCEHLKMIKNWHLVTIALLKEGGSVTLLLGDIDDPYGGTWITSKVVRLDLASGHVFTHSGSLYKLSGRRAEGKPSFEQLALLCKWIHRNGVGEVFGVPEFI